MGGEKFDVYCVVEGVFLIGRYDVVVGLVVVEYEY